MTRGLAFLAGVRPSDYGARLARLRWRRAARAHRVADWRGEDLAAEAVSGAGSWVVVCEPAALPVSTAPIPEPPDRRVLLAEAAVPETSAPVHTLRELEGARLRSEDPGLTRTFAALAFRSRDFPPPGDETVSMMLGRLLRDAASHATDPSFRVIRFEEPSRLERPELTRRLPAGALRILDVGCGAGGGIASARARNAAWNVTGIERDPHLAAQARARCDRVLEGDLREVLPRLAAEGERFDALVFADVLEHLEDPFGALHAARPLAASGAVLLVSVPNVGHLSVVRDLLTGRFDPVPAGLMDAGHLRWFTRDSLSQMLEEAGWPAASIQSQPGAPPGDPGPLRALAECWPDSNPESLSTYQWIAEARAR